jgi:tryptophanyl-tRNA synthetase
LYQLFSLFASAAERDEMAAQYRRGGFGYGEVKKALAAAAEQYFEPARARREELAAHPQEVKKILADGAARAGDKARDVLRRAQRACGVKD